MISLTVTIYLAVLVAEVVGDKTLYTVGSLAARHPSAAVLAGAAAGVCLKMLAAVVLGQLVAALPPLIVSVVSTVTFLGMAIGLWRSKPHAAHETPVAWAPGMRAAFLGIFLTEWGDFGQLTAVALVAQYGRPGLVWVSASLAMLTKVGIATLLGAGMGRWVPLRILRPITAATFVVVAGLAALRIS